MIQFSKGQLRTFVERSIEEAERGLLEGNYPIGSIVVNSNGEMVSSCHNENLTKDDISAHAEILCLRDLGIKKLSKDLNEDYYLFSSLEPCRGCGFFIARTNIKAIYMASVDPYKPGITVLKKSEQVGEIFKNIELIECSFPDLAKKSRLLMRDYLLSKGNTKAAEYYEK